MIPSLYTYNGHAINDTTNYVSRILLENEAQGRADITFVERPYSRPLYGGKTLKDYQMVIAIDMKGSAASQIDTIKGWFDVEDRTPHALVIKDTNNSDKQWYVNATTKRVLRLAPNAVMVTLAIADPVWMAVSETSASWTVTATAQTKSVTVGGNVNARPRITITPTTAGGGYTYKRYSIIRNRVTSDLVNYPIDITNGGFDTASLIKNTSNSVVINDGDGITDSDNEITYDGETGTLPTSGYAIVGDEQISYTGKTATKLTGVTRGLNGTTAAAHANDVVVYQSLMQADCDDIRVYMDGEEIPCWISGENSANTKVWIAQDWTRQIKATLDVAIADAGALDAIEFAVNQNNKKIIDLLPEQGTVLIQNELLRYTDKDRVNCQLTGITRGANGTTAAAHTKGQIVYYIEHDICIYYGNLDADARGATDTELTYDIHKPVFALTSTNTSWVYANFRSSDGNRAGSWSPGVSSKNTSVNNPTKYYSGVRGASANPATQMGAIISSFKNEGIWVADDANITWSLTNPCGFTTVTASGEKYRTSSSWPDTGTCKFSDDGLEWSSAWTDEATPASAGSWYALESHSSVSLSDTYPYLRFEFGGEVAGGSSKQAKLSYTDVTLALDSSTVPAVTLGAEQSNYQLHIRLKNNTSNESFVINCGMLLNGTLEVDCLDKEVILSGSDAEKDTRKDSALQSFSSVRNQWLDLRPGANILQVDDLNSSGTLDLTIKVYWKDRNN